MIKITYFKYLNINSLLICKHNEYYISNKIVVKYYIYNIYIFLKTPIYKNISLFDNR